MAWFKKDPQPKPQQPSIMGGLGSFKQTLTEEDLAHIRKASAGFLNAAFAIIPPKRKTYECLIYDLHANGWTIEEVKTLLAGGTINTPKQEEPATEDHVTI